MIELYTWGTPNGRKVSIALEELGLSYEVRPVDLGKGEQRRPEFLAINPNGKIPAIVDRGGPGGRPLALFESGAILLYLAEKAGALLPGDPLARHQAVAWLMFQMSAVGPTLGQLGYFQGQPEKNGPAIERFASEARRVLTVLDGRLAARDFLAGDYSVADIATYPWLAGAARRTPEILAGLAGLTAWMARVGGRPAVQRGMLVPA